MILITGASGNVGREVVKQRAMRHGDIRVTMNVYGDPVSDALRDASSKVAGRAISQSLTKSVS